MTEVASAHLYVGEVMHHRLRPRRHRFIYKVAYLLLDLDRLAGLDAALHLFSCNRPNLVSFYERDHGARDGSALRPWVEAQLAEHGIEGGRGGAIHLLCMPRWLGHVFNPISVYYCHDRNGRLAATVYEVKNTFGEQHVYVLPVDPERREGEAIRQGCAKALYVSPFVEMAGRYRFRLGAPGEDRLSVVIGEDVGAQPLLIASVTGRRRPLTDLQLLLAYLRHPTHKVMAAIHWEALRLWLKGIKIQPRPATGAHTLDTTRDRGASHLGSA